MIVQATLDIPTAGRGTYDITRTLEEAIRNGGVQRGLCHVFIRHTSASLLLCENADPDVRTDLETFMARLAPDGDPAHRHDAEGPDDMPAHIRTVLTDSELSIPIIDGRPGLGTWQGLYVWEHRRQSHRRQVILTLHGE